MTSSGMVEKPRGGGALAISELMLSTRAALLANRAVADALTGRAVERLQRGDERSAAAWALAAAQAASLHHGSQFASPRLEKVLSDLAVRWPRGPRGPTTARHVLHVASGLFPTGGHSRLLDNWARLDASRRHSLAVTLQAREQIPSGFVELIRERGGELFVLEESGDDLMSRARALASHAQALAPDLVILHTHPHDVVPSIALSGRGEFPRVGYMNHSDHRFWLGTHAADMFIHFRAATIKLSEERRGIPRERCAVLPIPVSPRPPRRSRAEVRRELGLGLDTPVVLSVGTAYKYSPLGPFRVEAVVEAVLSLAPQIAFVFAGPTPTGPFAELLRRWPERVRVLGPRTDVPDLLGASDAYLDSYPLGSATATLDAMIAGLAVVALRPMGLTNRFYQADGGALDGIKYQTSDVSVASTMVQQLVESPSLRAQVASENRESALRLHCGAEWVLELEAVYARLQHPPSAALTEPSEERTSDDELNILFFDAGASPDPAELAVEVSRYLSLSPRLGIQSRAAVRGKLPIASALPPRLRRLLRKVRHALRADRNS